MSTTNHQAESGTITSHWGAEKQELVLTQVVDASKERVFGMWTDPEQLARWWGPDGFTAPVCELDLRLGGHLRIDMRGPDGTIYPMDGTYHEIKPHEQLVFTSRPLDEQRKPLFEVLQTVTFSKEDSHTKLTIQARVLTITVQGAPYLQGMEEGWRQSLSRLGKVLTA